MRVFYRSRIDKQVFEAQFCSNVDNSWLAQIASVSAYRLSLSIRSWYKFSGMKTPTRHLSGKSIKLWSWLFPLTYLIHIAEEYWGGEGYPAYILRLRGVHLSTTRFLVAQSVGFILVTVGVILARQLHFPQMMLIILSAIVLVNGITHAVTSLTILEYGPGLFTSVFVWMPLAIFILLRFKHAVSKKRYWIGIAIGVGVNVVIGIFTMRGGRIT